MPSPTPNPDTRADASSRTRRHAQRAAAVSTGTLTLALALAGPAAADIGPVPVPTPPMPAPVAGVVQTVTDLTGLPDPLSSSSARPTGTTQHPAGRHPARHHRHLTIPQLVRGDTASPRTPTAGPARTAAAASTAPEAGTLPVGLRGPLTRTVADPATAPVTASTPPTTSVSLAAAAPRRAGIELPALPGPGRRELRVVLLALAGSAALALAGAHLRVIRELAPV